MIASDSEDLIIIFTFTDSSESYYSVSSISVFSSATIFKHVDVIYIFNIIIFGFTFMFSLKLTELKYRFIVMFLNLLSYWITFISSVISVGITLHLFNIRCEVYIMN